MEQENLKYTYIREERALRYFMPKELDQHVAQGLCKELDSLIASYQMKELILDFSQTEFMDSSGIGLVIGRQKTMKFRNGILYVENLGRRMETIFQSAGLFQIVKRKGENICI